MNGVGCEVEKKRAVFVRCHPLDGGIGHDIGEFRSIFSKVGVLFEA